MRFRRRRDACCTAGLFFWLFLALRGTSIAHKYTSQDKLYCELCWKILSENHHKWQIWNRVKASSHLITSIVLRRSYMIEAIGSHTIVPIAWYERRPRKTIILSLVPTQWQTSMEEQNSWPPNFSFIAVVEQGRSIEQGRSKRS